MSNIKDVSLQFCCKEDWNSFASIDAKSKFCATCQHRVVDFTNASAEDLAREKAKGTSLCGRFKRSQFSAAFLIGLTAAAGSGSCTEPLPLDTEPSQPIKIETPIEEAEYELSGIVFMDSLEIANRMHELEETDTTIEVFDEDKYFKDSE